jgi:ABC-type dipeptide/oligopeptide/nickel transport system permease component
MTRLARRWLSRLGQGIATLAGAAVLVWSLQLLAPGDPAREVLIAKGFDRPTPEQLAATRTALGLDEPAVVRFGRWLAGLPQGDLGTSWATGRPVAAELAERLPATVRLAVVALGLALVIAVPLALLAVAGRGRVLDLLARGVMFAGAAVPSFVVATLLLEIVVLQWGVGSVLADGTWGAAVLPAIPLAIGAAAVWARVLRTVMLERAEATYVEVARARGASALRRLLVHVLPGAVPALLTAAGMTVGMLLAGAAVVETVFTWPGIGRHLVAAIQARDVPVVQGIVLFGVLAYVVVSTVADAVADLIEPRSADA